ncbi:MAG TPA: oxygenase MpaB family protein [Gemmatimonadaceae bacterium]|jgi:hypothetical protein|nr:oxygenase MpaB family protein [Gemmatimonadaceae bacterium]
MSRFDVTRRIAALDPERDHALIVHYLVGWEFPWDWVRALEMALYRTFASPSISGLLDRTREFHARPQRRYDDTSLIMAEIMEWGYDGERGKEALRRMNRFHRHYDIVNEDFLYVLTTFHLEPIRWIDRFGWRRLTENEREASYVFWREVGRRMAIRDIPETRESFERGSTEYERSHFRYADTNGRVATATRELFTSWAPAALRPVVRVAIHAMLDDTMLTCFGFPRAPSVVRHGVAGALRLRGRAVRLLPAKTTKDFITGKPQRSWPTGYRIDQLGPPPLLEAREHDTSMHTS